MAVTVSAAALTAGCGGSGAPPAAPLPLTAVSRAQLDARGGELTFPSVGGYGATFQYTSNDATAGATALIVTTVHPVLVYPPGNTPVGSVLSAFTFTLSRSVRFRGWNRLPTTVTIPLGLSVAGHSLEIDAYDTTTNVAIGINPGSVHGTVVTFPAGAGPVTLLAHTYLCVLTLR